MEEVKELEISLIDAPADPIRDFIDPEEVRELAESIREVGLLEPIQVRPVNGRYEVVFGHRRFLASKLIGKDKIRAVIKDMSDQEVIVCRLVENVQRANLDPIEEAKVYKKMRDVLNLSISQIAKRVGKAVNTIKYALDLLELEEEYQEAIRKKKLGKMVAIILNEIKDEAFRKMYFKAAIENGVTDNVAKEWVNDYKKTLVGNYYSEIGSGGVSNISADDKPIYRTCYFCKGPERIEKVKLIEVCQECLKEFERG